MTSKQHHPSSVTHARRASDEAWEAYNAEVDMYEAYNLRMHIDAHTPDQVARLDRLRSVAVEAERRYHEIIAAAETLEAVRRSRAADAEAAINTTEAEPVAEFDPDDDPADDEHKQRLADERADWMMQAYPNLN